MRILRRVLVAGGVTSVTIAFLVLYGFGALSESSAAPPADPEPEEDSVAVAEALVPSGELAGTSAAYAGADAGEATEPGEPDQVVAAEPPPAQQTGDEPDEDPGSVEEVTASPEASAPEVPDDPTLYLSVPGMSRVSGVPVRTAAATDSAALRAGALHPRGSGFPWEEEANVYIAGHRVGYAGTGSFLLFYDLDTLEAGDEIHLEDSLGRTYLYTVTGKKVIEPGDTSVMEPEEGREVLKLQSCTLPDYRNRLVVTAEKVREEL